MNHLSVICLVTWSVTVTAAAQPPAGYYDSAGALTGRALQQALHEIIDDHTVVGYTGLYNCFLTTDDKPGNIVWDMYSDVPDGTPAYIYYYLSTQECGNYDSEADCYNREHSFPKSWFDDQPPMNSDLFHIYPTDGYVNNRRANYPFGETASAIWTSTNGSKVGPSSWPGYTGIVFEPIDEYKGDFARTYFYMATRYYGEDSAWPGSDMTDGSQLKEWALNMLLAWHRADAVSTKEVDRNNEVYKYQANRNPFIDDPDFTEKIWGTLNAVEEAEGNEAILRLYPIPATGELHIGFRDYDCSGGEAYVYDIRGCLVMTAMMEEGDPVISVADLSPGIYFIRISCDQEIITESFVVGKW